MATDADAAKQARVELDSSSRPERKCKGSGGNVVSATKQAHRRTLNKRDIVSIRRQVLPRIGSFSEQTVGVADKNVDN